MLQRREIPAGFRLALQIDRRDDTTPAARQALHDAAPIINNQAVAVGFAAIGMEARLCRSDYVTQIFDGASAHQRFPMGAPGGSGKPPTPRTKGSWAEKAALPLAWVVLFIVFAVQNPDRFLSMGNISNILGSQSILFMLALAALLPSMVGDIDLSLASQAHADLRALGRFHQQQ